MKIVYKPHLHDRLKERGIPDAYKDEIISNPDKEYFDNVSGRRILIKKLQHKDRLRNIVVVYDIIEGTKEIITSYPIRDSEIKNKVKAGRWTEYEKK